MNAKEIYPENIRHFSISDEVDTAGRLIRVGLGALQDTETCRDFLHLPMLVLANGFERLMKVIICFSYHEQHGSYPSINKIKGHRLEVLLDNILPLYTKEFLERSAIKEDLKFLKKDKLLRSALEILSDFGDKERYYSLDIVVGQPVHRGSPDDRWGSDVEFAIINQHPEWADQLGNPNNDIPERVAKEIVILFERFTRALSRLFTIGNIGRNAKANSPFLSDFIGTMDRHLGKRKYTLSGRREYIS